jgi:hypothetical protein
LASISERVEKSRMRIISADKDLRNVSTLLKNDIDEVKGNGALIISNCGLLVEPEPIYLIEPLLNVVNTSNKESVKKNAGIAVR